MVLDESLLPAHILAKQPKSKSSKSSNKIVPVRFFSDDTYIWINTNDIKPLNSESIQEYFTKSSSKRRKDTLLDTAFELANNPPDMNVFIKYGSKGEPDEEEEEEEDEVLSIPAKKKQRQQSSKKSQPIKKEPSTPKKKVEVKKKTNVVVEEVDNDWGLDEFNRYDVEHGNFIYESEQEQNKVFSKVENSINAALLKKFKSIESKIIESLLSDTIDFSKIEESLNELNGILHKLPTSVISKSKLLRCLILAIRKRDDSLDTTKKGKISKVLVRLGIDVRENTEEEMTEKQEEEKEPTVEPEQQQQDAIKPEEPVVVELNGD
ncbi:IOC4 ISWI one complex protein 4 [Candida maltosa Xu316]